MQKYIHLVQIVETEKVAANQLRTQLEDQDTEIERLKFEVTVYAWAVPFNELFSNMQSNFMNQWTTLDPINLITVQVSKNVAITERSCILKVFVTYPDMEFNHRFAFLTLLFPDCSISFCD